MQKSFKSSLESIVTSQREADRVFRDWAARAGWMPPAGSEAPPEARAAKAPEADTLKEEVAVLREQLRALEERLEKRRER